jgi:hypothetical protein
MEGNIAVNVCDFASLIRCFVIAVIRILEWAHMIRERGANEMFALGRSTSS